MKPRLRILLAILFVTLGLLVLRVEYLKRCAAFHEREAARYAEMIATAFHITPWEVDTALEVAASNRHDFRLDYKFHVVLHHQEAAVLYREAAFHPWTVVHAPSPPERHYDD